MKKFSLLFIVVVLVACTKTVSVNSIIYDKNAKLNILKSTNEPFTGKAVGLHKNGKIMIEKNYKYGKLNDDYIEYYENGQIKWKRNWKDGERDGKHIGYFENGNIKCEEYWDKGKFKGEKDWDKDGNLIWEKFY